MKHCGSFLATALLAVSGLEAQARPAMDSLRKVAETIPLFATHEVLELRIEAPFTTIFKDRNEDSEYQRGTLSYIDEAGDSVTLDIRARTRGSFRLQRRICDFPNLHINFRRRQVENTVFAGLNRVSIVAHCQDDQPEYEQFTLQEYLIYRTFNLLSDNGVRVRLTRATYIDTDGDLDSLTKYMFILEPFDMAAASHGWEVLEVPAVPPSQLDRFALPLLEAFQFMIGNTDWSPFEKSTNGICCHNGRLIGTMSGPVIPIPYDFDWSGIIDAPYAKPAPEVGVADVRYRRYWGTCHPVQDFAPVFESFNERRDAIYELWRTQEGLDQEVLERSLEYFDGFYEIINDSGKTRREIALQCRDMSYLEPRL
jgi:hypothetical protein